MYFINIELLLKLFHIQQTQHSVKNGTLTLFNSFCVDVYLLRIQIQLTSFSLFVITLINSTEYFLSLEEDRCKKKIIIYLIVRIKIFDLEIQS